MRGLLAGFTGLVHDRLALLGTELREEVARVRSTLVGAFAAILLGGLGLAFVGVAVVLAVDESRRVGAAAAVALAFLAAAAYASWKVRRILAAKAGAFSASLAELERDRQALLERGESERKSFAKSSREIMNMVSIGLLAYDIARRVKRG